MSERFSVRPARREDLESVTALLAESGMHTEGIEDHFPAGFAVAEHGTELVGACGIEVYRPFGLLRSMVVSPRWRGRSIGTSLVDDRLSWAIAAGLRSLCLLTLDADRYFERFGFSRIDRDAVPTEIRGSFELRSLCPVSAIVMVRSIGGQT